MEKYINKNYRFNYKHYLRYFWENQIIGLKSITEYRVNSINIILLEIFDILIINIFGFLIMSKFGNLIDWTFKDFFTFFIFQNTLYLFVGFFSWSKKLNEFIKLGELNMYLSRPGNIFLNYFFINKMSPILYLSINIPFLIWIFLTIKVDIINYFLIFFVSIILILFFIILWQFFESFAFLFLESRQILFTFFLTVRENLKIFNSNFFSGTNFKYFLYLFPIYFVGTLIIPLTQNKIPENLLEQIVFIILLLIFLTFITFVNWKYGIKRYEAFN